MPVVSIYLYVYLIRFKHFKPFEKISKCNEVEDNEKIPVSLRRPESSYFIKTKYSSWACRNSTIELVFKKISSRTATGYTIIPRIGEKF